MNSIPKYCFLDVETTGTNFARNGITQIAGIICSVDGEEVRELEQFSFDVAPFPSDAIEQEALAISGHTVEEIRGFEQPTIIHGKLTKVFEKYCDKYNKKDKMIFLGYNASFDYGFLRKWFDKVGDKYFGSWFWNPPIDVMSLAALHLTQVRSQLVDFKLTTVATHLGVKIEKPHDPLSDVRATKEIFLLVR